MKKKCFTFILAFQLVLTLCFTNSLHVKADPVIGAPSVVLMESSTGKIIYENNAFERRSPASITKIMTLLLTFEAIEDGRVKLDDKVITSEYASSMGGSQVFLAQGEEQTLDTMIKCIAVASGNDASVAVAEHISGSEQAFVQAMNERAKELGMLDTHFEDCCGLSDSEGHYSCARDVAVMSRELTCKFPQIFDYTQIWMEDIIHETNQGSSKFTLISTNKLLKQYRYATGLKTGSTSKAKFCLSATASKDGIDLIAVVMGAPDKNVRLADAQTLLTYGFGVCRIYTDENNEPLQQLAIEQGKEERVSLKYASEFRYLDTEGLNLNEVEKKLELPEYVPAPVYENEQAGRAVYYLAGEEIGEVPILYADTIEKASFFDCYAKVLAKFLL